MNIFNFIKGFNSLYFFELLKVIGFLFIASFALWVVFFVGAEFIEGFTNLLLKRVELNLSLIGDQLLYIAVGLWSLFTYVGLVAVLISYKSVAVKISNIFENFKVWYAHVSEHGKRAKDK